MDKKRTIILLIFIILFISAVLASLLYYSNKYSISFETGTNEIILTKYVSKNKRVSKPVEPIKEGYVFKEWQLNGETFDFDNVITNDIILTAKWVKEEYITVIFNTDSEYKIENKDILKGEALVELPIPIKENYKFVGWYLNDNLYSNQKLYDDVILTARYVKEELNIIYEVGDKVKIVGNYASSAYSNYYQDFHKSAIGWEREILGIIEDSEFPYIIGNKNGVTGFFKKTSIKKI